MTSQLNASAPEKRVAYGCFGRPSARQMWWGIVFLISATGGSIVLRHASLPPVAQDLIAVFPVFAGVFYMNALIGDVRAQMDELQLRIYLEAAAMVVCGLFVLTIVYPGLQAAHLVGPLDWDIVLMFIMTLGIIAYVRAMRRYR